MLCCAPIYSVMQMLYLRLVLRNKTLSLYKVVQATKKKCCLRVDFKQFRCVLSGQDIKYTFGVGERNDVWSVLYCTQLHIRTQWTTVATDNVTDRPNQHVNSTLVHVKVFARQFSVLIVILTFGGTKVVFSFEHLQSKVARLIQHYVNHHQIGILCDANSCGLTNTQQNSYYWSITVVYE